jgi:hypothetical protein
MVKWANNRPINFKFKFSLKLKESEAQIKRHIIEQLKNHYSPKLLKASQAVNTELRALFLNKIHASQTYKSLKGDGDRSLLGHFGFDDGGAKVDEIVNRWVNSFDTEMFIKSTTSKMSFGFQVYTINKSFADVLGMEAAWQDTGKAGKVGILRGPASYEVKLPWLRWLLLSGDSKTLLTEQEYTIHFESGKGRSGQAIMAKSKTKRWGVPREYGDAGTIEDNWVINIINELYPLMDGIFDRAIEKYLH